jgi:hypothetical protein
MRFADAVALFVLAVVMILLSWGLSLSLIFALEWVAQ